MKDKPSPNYQIEDIIEVEDNILSLEDIVRLANNRKRIQEYEIRYKDCLYSTILMSLTHERYTETEAKLLWNAIVAHMKSLNNNLGRQVGIAVASLDYLSNIKNELSDPLIIEERKSNFVAEATTKDELTGLYVREVFDVILNKEIDEANRTGSPLCLLMLDIDDFKKINDRYGHQEGDTVLNKLGTLLNSSVREMDTAVRYGGEELAIIMPRISLKKALNAAQRIRESIEKTQFNNFSVTVSIGVSQSSALLKTPMDLIRSADNALYEAKERGKNLVVAASIPE